MEETVLKALRILEALALADAGVGVNELGAKLDLAKAHTHRVGVRDVAEVHVEALCEAARAEEMAAQLG